MTASQPGLWQQQNVAAGFLELFPAVWGLAEALCGPDVSQRREALARLEELGAPRLSPLVAYLIGTRLGDPDLGVRGRAVRILGDLLTPDPHGKVTPETVRRYENAFLSQMRTRRVFNLLEVAVADPEATPHISRVLDASPYAGRHLSDIALDRMMPLPHRKQAVLFIGTVGYLEAIPALERLAARLEARLSGQQAMTFAPPSQSEENELLPIVRSVLHLLQAP
jgi:HEAT repeat protein